VVICSASCPANCRRHEAGGVRVTCAARRHHDDRGDPATTPRGRGQHDDERPPFPRPPASLPPPAGLGARAALTDGREGRGRGSEAYQGPDDLLLSPNRLPLLRPYSLRKFAANTLLTSASGRRVYGASFLMSERPWCHGRAWPAPASSGSGGHRDRRDRARRSGRRPPAASRRVPRVPDQQHHAAAGGCQVGGTTTVPGPSS